MSRTIARLFFPIGCYALALAAEPQESNASQLVRCMPPAPLDYIPSSWYFGPGPFIGFPDTDPVWSLAKRL